MICMSFEFEDLELSQLNDPVLRRLLHMGIADWTGINQRLHQATQVIHHSTAVAMRLTDCNLVWGEEGMQPPSPII